MLIRRFCVNGNRKIIFKKATVIFFDEVVEKVTAALGGVGVRTRLDVRKILKENLNVDFRPYIILSDCNTDFALGTLQEEEQIGLLLTCNVVVRDLNGRIKVLVVDRKSAMLEVRN